MDASVTVCEGGIWDGYFVHLFSLLFIYYVYVFVFYCVML